MTAASTPSRISFIWIASATSSAAWISRTRAHSSPMARKARSCPGDVLIPLALAPASRSEARAASKLSKLALMLAILTSASVCKYASGIVRAADCAASSAKFAQAAGSLSSRLLLSSASGCENASAHQRTPPISRLLRALEHSCPGPNASRNMFIATRSGADLARVLTLTYDWRSSMYTQHSMSDETLLENMVRAAVAAGRAALEVYNSRFEVELKADDSPVTAADHAAERVILEQLSREAPGIPVVAEEQVAMGRVPAHGADFLLVDPLDGTREFIKRNGEFTMNIALVSAGSPVLGVVYAPAIAALFAGNAIASKAWRSNQDASAPAAPRESIRVRSTPPEGLTVVASRSHRSPETDAYLARYPVAHAVSVGSSLKFCKVAAGEADLYPRLGTTMEWDTAAGHAILVAAGGRVLTDARTPLGYGKPDYRNPWFIATGSAEVLALAGIG